MLGRVGLELSAITAILLMAAVGAQAESHVRIVRLSYIDGQVQMAHADQGLDRAILNTPIVQGTRIVTRNDGLAEVEFEDQSALRLAENSEVKFRQLSMNDAGVKVNEIEVVRGVVFFDVCSKSSDVYRAVAEGTTLLVRRDTLTRISAAPDQLQVTVFKGDVQLENQPQLVSIKKNETLTLDPNQPSDYKVAHGTEALPVDAWNKEREAYTSAYAGNQGYGGPRSGYGLQDLNYYGNYLYASGYGYVWQPYGFANSMIGWNPYSNGAWGFVPGFGYTWASAYPWGWLPYHYGSWAFLGGGIGWAWVPGSYPAQWYANNFQATPVVVKPPAGWQPVTAPVAPAGNSPKPTILVGKAAGVPAYIPGGRIPPNFSSVIAGRNAGTTAVGNELVSPTARNNRTANQSVSVPNAVRNRQSGHVFAAPQSASATSGFSSMGASPGLGASSGGYGTGANSGGKAGSATSGGHASSGHGSSSK
jgi:uncharacterized membrane protein YgcG